MHLSLGQRTYHRVVPGFEGHLEQLVRLGHLKEFVLEPRGQETEKDARP